MAISGTSHKIGGDADHSFTGFQLSNQCAVVVNFARGAHLLTAHAKHITVISAFAASSHNDILSKPKGLPDTRTHDVRVADGHQGDKEPVAAFSIC